MKEKQPNTKKKPKKPSDQSIESTIESVLGAGAALLKFPNNVNQNLKKEETPGKTKGQSNDNVIPIKHVQEDNLAIPTKDHQGNFKINKTDNCISTDFIETMYKKPGTFPVQFFVDGSDATIGLDELFKGFLGSMLNIGHEGVNIFSTGFIAILWLIVQLLKGSLYQCIVDMYNVPFRFPFQDGSLLPKRTHESNKSYYKICDETANNTEALLIKCIEFAPKILRESWIQTFIFLQDRADDVYELLRFTTVGKDLLLGLLDHFHAPMLTCTSLIVIGAQAKQNCISIDAFEQNVLTELNVPKCIVFGSFKEMAVQRNKLTVCANYGSVAMYKEITEEHKCHILPNKILLILIRNEQYLGVKGRDIIDALLRNGTPVFYAQLQKQLSENTETIMIYLLSGRDVQEHDRRRYVLISTQVFDSALQAAGLQLTSGEPIVMYDRVRVESGARGEPRDELAYIVYHPDDCRLFIFIPTLPGSYLDTKEGIWRY